MAEYICWDSDGPFELVSATELLQGSHRGDPYRSIQADLGAAQRTVLQSVISSQEAYENISQRHGDIKAQLPKEEESYADLVANIGTNFGNLRAVIDVLETAVLEQAQLCHEDNIAKLKDELGTCAALEAELDANLSITREFVWAEDQRDARAPPKVARSDMRLAEIAEMSLEQVVAENLADTIDLTTIEAATTLLTNCASESGLGENLAACGVSPSSDSVIHQDAPLPVGDLYAVEGRPKVHDRLHRNARKKQVEERVGPPPFSSTPVHNGYFQDPKGTTEILRLQRDRTQHSPTSQSKISPTQRSPRR